jgi:ABC-2 type transport system ATP-binding protein
VDENLIIDLRDRGKTVIMCSHRLEDVQDICDRIAILNLGELQKLGSVKGLLEDVQRLELRASGVQLNDALRRDLEEVLARHGGSLEFIGHPTTTLEDLFLRVVQESKAHPGRRYLPERAPRPGDGQKEAVQAAPGPGGAQDGSHYIKEKP